MQNNESILFDLGRRCTTLDELRKSFESDSILKKLFKEEKEITEKEKRTPRRYFFHDNEILLTGDNKRVALTTQWGLNFSHFMKIQQI